ncbi:MAG: transposase [Bacteroidota bacterium]
MGLRGRIAFKDSTCFFVTTTCNGFKHLFLDERYYTVLKKSLLFLNEKYKVELLAYVLMPNHVHLVLNFIEENHLSAYMRDFKKYTAYRIRKLFELDDRKGLLKAIEYERGKQKFKVWQDRFDDVVIETENVLTTKIEYIHQNPVRAKLVNNPEEYSYSSAGYYHSIFNEDPLVISFR